MKIHSDTLNTFHLDVAVKAAGVGIIELLPAGSRTRKCAFNIYLSGSSKYAARQRDCFGYTCKAATYNEWGVFLARLYKIDRKMVAGPYKGRADFHRQTKGVFA